MGADKVEALRAGTGMPSERLGNVIRECFETIFSQGGGPGGFPGGPGEFPGRPGEFPGGPNDQDGPRGLDIRDGILQDLSRNLPLPAFECVKAALDDSVLTQGQSGIRSLIETCLSQFSGSNSGPEGNSGPGSSNSGPGGGFPSDAPQRRDGPSTGDLSEEIFRKEVRRQLEAQNLPSPVIDCALSNVSPGDTTGIGTQVQNCFIQLQIVPQRSGESGQAPIDGFFASVVSLLRSFFPNIR